MTINIETLSIFEYISDLENDVKKSLSFPSPSDGDLEYIIKVLYFRNLYITKDICLLLKNMSIYNSCVLLSSLIENYIMIEYFLLNPEEAIRYKNYSTIEDLNRIKDGTWKDVPDATKDEILRICKNECQEFKKNDVIFTSNEDYLDRDNYKSRFLPSFQDIFKNIVKDSKMNENINHWQEMEKAYKEACKFKHMNSEKIITQFNYTGFLCYNVEKTKDREWCFTCASEINNRLFVKLLYSIINKQTYDKYKNKSIMLD